MEYAFLRPLSLLFFSKPITDFIAVRHERLERRVRHFFLQPLGPCLHRDRNDFRSLLQAFLHPLLSFLVFAQALLQSNLALVLCLQEDRSRSHPEKQDFVSVHVF